VRAAAGYCSTTVFRPMTVWGSNAPRPASRVYNRAVSERSDRVARNEAMFRDINERVADLSREVDRYARTDFLCECGNSECMEVVPLTLIEYEMVRTNPTHFVLRPGHESQGFETIVEETDRFVVVEKHASESATALDSDPRS
jgi:hypothetical protein